MRKSTFFLFLLSVLLLGTTEVIASSGLSHTNTPIELKPISLNNSFQIAAVCFLGTADCGDAGFGKDDEDMGVDTGKQCQNEGFNKNTCSSVQIPVTPCPYDEIGYGKGCKCRPDLVSCNSPYVGSGEACGGKYASCECPPTVSPSTNETCSLTCDGNCIETACNPATSETGCSYGTQSCSDGCGGTRSCCSAYVAPPAPACSNECPSYSSRGTSSGCAYGGDDCYDGCGGSWWHNCNSAPSDPDPAPSNPCDYLTAANCGGLGCKSTYSNCSSKCQTCNTAPAVDPCDGLTDANCGSLGCKSKYSNCSSKCQTCNTPPADPCDSITAIQDCGSGRYCSSYNSSCKKCTACGDCGPGYTMSSCSTSGSGVTSEPGMCMECGGGFKKECFDEAYMSGGTCIYDCREFDDCMSRTGDDCNSCRTYANAPTCEHPYSSCR